jgi:CRP-like cAMP-binding protein
MQIGNRMTSDAVTLDRSRPVPVVDYTRLVDIGHDSYLDLLTRLKSLSWLSAAELAALAARFARTSFKRNQVVLRNAELESEAHILLKGIVRVTCLNVRAERVTIALIAPGPIPQFPRISFGPAEFQFQYEAYSDCSIGSLAWADFERITAQNSTSAVKSFHENDLKHWYRLLLRSSSYLNRDLGDRIAATLLDLRADFGIEESRGTMLRGSSPA